MSHEPTESRHGMSDEESRLAAIDWLVEREGLTEEQAGKVIDQMAKNPGMSEEDRRALIDKYKSQ